MTSAKIYSFVSPKGGSGKTITTVTWATVLGGLNRSVLIVDADASTNGLSLFFLDKVTEFKEESTISGSGTFDKELFRKIQTFPISENVSIAPASFVMSQTEEIPAEVFRNRLDRMLQSWRKAYDYIFIDAQAGTDVFAETAISLSDQIIIVSEYDPMSVQGIERLKILFRDTIQSKPTWTLFNKVLPDFVPALGEFLAIARYLVPVPWDADVVRAYVRRRSPVDMTKGNTHTLAAIQSILSLLGPEISEEVDGWKARQEEMVRKPAEDKLRQTESLIQDLEIKKIEIRYKRERARRWTTFMIGLTIMIISSAVVLFPEYIGIYLMRASVSAVIAIIGVLIGGFVSLRTVFFRFDSVDPKTEREMVTIDLELQKLMEERTYLSTVTRLGIGEIYHAQEGRQAQRGV